MVSVLSKYYFQVPEGDGGGGGGPYPSYIVVCAAQKGMAFELSALT